jgi:hypothetical protein
MANWLIRLEGTGNSIPSARSQIQPRDAAEEQGQYAVACASVSKRTGELSDFFSG